MVGRAVLRALQQYNVKLLSAPHDELDLTNQRKVYDWLKINKPDLIIMTAGKVGGIGANNADKAGFLHENLAMAQNVIHGAYLAKVSKLVYLGSSCIYPKQAEQPIQEEALLTAPLEPTNEGYALAKIAGVKLCEFYNLQYGCDFISAMPCNLYGSHDHFDAEKSHVIPAMILKLHEAKKSGQSNTKFWGTGAPLREFLYVDDLANGILYLAQHYNAPHPINIGSGVEITIKNLAQMIADIIGYEGRIEFDDSKPDGTIRKCLDNKRVNALGWKAKTLLEQGLKQTYDWFLSTNFSA